MTRLNYLFSELRRRRSRTIFTALGLAVGVGLVITVSALSAGLDRAQQQVLGPLTGVGTDMSVTRPITVSRSDRGFQGLSDQEREQLRDENGAARADFQNLEPGTKFSRDVFMASSQLSFDDSQVSRIAVITGVTSAAGGLTLNMTHISGTVPEQSSTSTQQGGFGQNGPPPSAGSDSGGGGPSSIDLNSTSVSGVDQSHPAIGAITSGETSAGTYFTKGDAHEAILNVSYAERKNLGLGDTVTIGGKKFTVIGLAKTPLGGQSSDVYVKLSQLQKLSGRTGRVNTVYVRATSADVVDSVAAKITSGFDGASVSTAKTLADRVSGSLVDAKNLTSKLGFALELVALLAAILIASLLTLASVSKRVRELGTLKAIGWPKRLVVGQIAGESVVQALLGGVLGVAFALAGAALITAFAPTLEATVANAAQQALPGPFGQGAVESTSSPVSLTAHVSPGLALIAVLLALAGGLVAGSVGAWRAARLRPVEALRHLD